MASKLYNPYLTQAQPKSQACAKPPRIRKLQLGGPRPASCLSLQVLELRVFFFMVGHCPWVAHRNLELQLRTSYPHAPPNNSKLSLVRLPWLHFVIIIVFWISCIKDVDMCFSLVVQGPSWSFPESACGYCSSPSVASTAVSRWGGPCMRKFRKLES